MPVSSPDPYRAFGDFLFMMCLSHLDDVDIVAAFWVSRTWAAIIGASVNWRAKYLESGACPAAKSRWVAWVAAEAAALDANDGSGSSSPASEPQEGNDPDDDNDSSDDNHAHDGSEPDHGGELDYGSNPEDGTESENGIESETGSEQQDGDESDGGTEPDDNNGSDSGNEHDSGTESDDGTEPDDNNGSDSGNEHDCGTESDDGTEPNDGRNESENGSEPHDGHSVRSTTPAGEPGENNATSVSDNTRTMSGLWGRAYAEWMLTEAAWDSGKCKVWNIHSDDLDGWRRGNIRDTSRNSGSQLISDPESNLLFITNIGGETRVLHRLTGKWIAYADREFHLERHPGLGPSAIGSWHCDKDGQIEYTLIITAAAYRRLQPTLANLEFHMLDFRFERHGMPILYESNRRYLCAHQATPCHSFGVWAMRVVGDNFGAPHYRSEENPSAPRISMVAWSESSTTGPDDTPLRFHIGYWATISPDIDTSYCKEIFGSHSACQLDDHRLISLHPEEGLIHWDGPEDSADTDQDNEALYGPHIFPRHGYYQLPTSEITEDPSLLKLRTVKKPHRRSLRFTSAPFVHLPEEPGPVFRFLTTPTRFRGHVKLANGCAAIVPSHGPSTVMLIPNYTKAFRNALNGDKEGESEDEKTARHGESLGCRTIMIVAELSWPVRHLVTSGPRVAIGYRNLVYIIDTRTLPVETPFCMRSDEELTPLSFLALPRLPDNCELVGLEMDGDAVYQVYLDEYSKPHGRVFSFKQSLANHLDKGKAGVK